MCEDRGKRIVLVTGFGPFQNHPINTSWLAVKKLRNMDIEKVCNITLVTEKIPVTYAAVSTLIPELWSKHNPMLVIHVGVGNGQSLQLETCAHMKKYVKKDIEEALPLKENEDEEECDLELSTDIDVKKIRDKLNKLRSIRQDGFEASVSNDAGRYLCEYIFSRSLSIDRSKTMFVHVPNKLDSITQIANGLYDIIRIALKIHDVDNLQFIEHLKI